MRVPEPERLGLVQPADDTGEWWVTLDGRCVIGFSGETAHERAEKYFLELTSIGQGVHSHAADRPRRKSPSE
jgi:hypothetical protein